MIVVKVGGSLHDLPDLKTRLNAFLRSLAEREVVLVVPGGGPNVDALRARDDREHLGQEACHRLAIAAMDENSEGFFNLLFPCERMPWEVAITMTQNNIYVCVCGPRMADHADLPQTWDVTSDSIALYFSIHCAARQLILLKSVDAIVGTDWYHHADMGIVDRHFPQLIDQYYGDVQIINFRKAL